MIDIKDTQPHINDPIVHYISDFLTLYWQMLLLSTDYMPKIQPPQLYLW